MARPIAPTPPLHGQAALDFFAAMQNVERISEAERRKIKEGAARIKSMLTFEF